MDEYAPRRILSFLFALSFQLRVIALVGASMESAGEHTAEWRFAANWAVTGGSLGRAVTVESSASPIDEATLGTAPKSPVVLSPPSSADHGPCEITINFLQRYEVRQVYVRSTSRVYEIYYSPKPKAENEYLCTVRCGMAAKVDASDSPSSSELTTVSPSDSSDGLDDGKMKDDSSNSNDDEWVKIKTPISSKVTDPSPAFPSKECAIMDRYEATAEISDAEPCISLTLRLLSIQSLGCVYVDEVYVFVDPIDPDSEVQENRAEMPAGNSLLSILVPSLLQLSKSKGAFHLPERASASSSALQNQTESRIEMKEQDRHSEESKSNPTSSLEVNKQEVRSEVAEPVYNVLESVHQTSQIPHAEEKSEASCSRIETILEQLVSRVSRIEDLFTRFEENMLKPINNIEVRLQHVEQQLVALNEKTHNSGELSCKRFSAPEYSMSDSMVNSNGNESEVHDLGDVELNRKECSDKISVPPDADDSDSESSGQLLPCLTITAPDFSQGDDEEEQIPTDENQAVAESTIAKRPAVSIDDALASALAGFLSCTSTQPQRYSQPLAVRAPEFSNEYENCEENASPRVQCDAAAADSSICPNVAEEMNTSISSPCGLSYKHACEEVGIENEKLGQDSEEGKSHEARDMADDEATPVAGSTASHQIIPDEDGILCSEPVSILGRIEPEASEKFHVTHITSSHCAVVEEVETNKDQVQKEDSEEDVLHDVLACSRSASTLDFEAPILDVNFASQQNGTSKSTIEALLGSLLEEPDCAIPLDGVNPGAFPSHDRRNFIELEDAIGPDPSVAVDVDYCSLQELFPKPGSEKLQDDCSHSYEVSARSLI